MASREAYYERLTAKGKTRRDRELSAVHRAISTGVSDLLSSHTVLLRNEEIDITVEATEIMSVKKFTAAPDVVIGHGDYIVWDNVYWLVTERDYDDEIYIRGKMTQCNYYLKWQNDIGEIIGRWCVINQVTRYNNGVFEGKVVDNIESTLSIMIVSDSETEKLKREKRFLADTYSEEPYAYKITQRDVLSNRYGSSGLITWAVSQDVYNPEVDNRELMIANYRNTPVTSTISGPSGIRIGQRAIYTTNIPANWNLTSGDPSFLTVDGDTAVLSIPADRTLIGTVLKMSDGNTELEIKIMPVY